MSDTNTREPLLSEDAMDALIYSSRTDEFNDVPHERSAANVRDFYESKITSGELAVVKTVKVEAPFNDQEWFGRVWCCDGCDARFMTGDESYNNVAPDPEFCPGCGAKIIA